MLATLRRKEIQLIPKIATRRPVGLPQKEVRGIAVRDRLDLERALIGVGPGDAVEMTCRRNGQTFRVILEFPPAAPSVRANQPAALEPKPLVIPPFRK
ncbi:MAG: hypothetical protein HYR96_06610 [Deltaproteobacteria bacterium]|nr:hypothetical protein [Deltaproteobacteria bacterium]MBI3295742.1 hypothetical protein [Deltaproteobacteria bacterium]